MKIPKTLIITAAAVMLTSCGSAHDAVAEGPVMEETSAAAASSEVSVTEEETSVSESEAVSEAETSESSASESEETPKSGAETAETEKADDTDEKDSEDFFVPADEKILKEIADFDHASSDTNEFFIKYVPGSGYSVLTEKEASDIFTALAMSEKSYEITAYSDKSGENYISYEEYRDMIRDYYFVPEDAPDPEIIENCVIIDFWNNSWGSFSESEWYPAVFTYVTEKLCENDEICTAVSEKLDDNIIVGINVSIWRKEKAGNNEECLSLNANVQFPFMQEDEIDLIDAYISREGKEITDEEYFIA